MTAAPPGWTHIDGQAGDRLVLAVDFDGTGRPEATFRELVQQLPGDVGLQTWHAVPPPEPTRRSADRYLSWWSDTPGPSGTPVDAVFGYCAGSAFACALADAIEQRQDRRPRVVLFNPGRPSVATLCRDLGGVVRAMTALTDSEQAALQARIDTIRDRSGVDFEVAGTAVVLLYREACATVIERWEVDKDVGDALIELFEAYVSYLAAVRQIEPRPQWGSSLSLTAAEQRGAGFTQHETVFDLPRGVLLRSPGVAAAVAELMAR